MVSRRAACRAIALSSICTASGGDANATESNAVPRNKIMKNLLPSFLLATEVAHPSLGDAAHVFDRVVGSWDMDCVFTAVDGTKTFSAGEWHFGWILGGYALQDVLYFYPKGQRPRDATDMKGGTTLRLFDRRSGEWLVSFFAPLRGDVIHLHGGAEGSRIMLKGLDVDGSPLRWSFNEIEDNRFRWLGEISADGGSTWRVEQEMHLRRMPLGAIE